MSDTCHAAGSFGSQGDALADNDGMTKINGIAWQRFESLAPTELAEAIKRTEGGQAPAQVDALTLEKVRSSFDVASPAGKMIETLLKSLTPAAAALASATTVTDVTAQTTTPAVAMQQGVAAGFELTLPKKAVDFDKPLTAIELINYDAPLLGVFGAPGDKAVAVTANKITVRNVADLTSRGTTFDVAPQTLTQAAMSPNGRVLAAACNDGSVKLFDPVTGTSLDHLFGHVGQINAIAFSRDGSQLATAGQDGTVRIWDVATGRMACPPLQCGSQVALAFNASGTRLLATGDTYLRAIDAKTGAQSTYVGLGHNGIGIDVSPDGQTIIAATPYTMRSFKLDEAANTLSETRAVNQQQTGAPRFSPDGKRIAVPFNGFARIYDLDFNVKHDLGGHRGTVSAVAFSRDGTQLLTSSHDKSVRVTFFEAI